MRQKKLGGNSILEAFESLSSLAALKSDSPSKQEALLWLDSKNISENHKKIKKTFQILNAFFEYLYHKQRAQLSDPLMQREITAILQLAAEAVEGVKHHPSFFKALFNTEQMIPEYEELKQFYEVKIVKKIQQATEGESWGKEVESKDGEELNLEKQALRDLESVSCDRDYDLFNISKEDGTSFFNPTLLHYIRMAGSFEESLGSEDDMLKQAESLLTRDYHVSAREILNEAANLIEEFYKNALRYKDLEMVAALNKACMALMLAANPHHLMRQSGGKNCQAYFVDFQKFLRQALVSDEYRRFSARAVEKLEVFHRVAFHLAEALCGLLFMRDGAQKEILFFLHNLLRGERSGDLHATLLERDQMIRESLKNCPSGPLLKALETLHESHKKRFDPFLQHNVPAQRFSIHSESLHVTFMHLPAPVHQEFIDRIDIVEEFKGYLNSLNEKKHLLINLQDRMSWKEHHRSISLENLSTKGQYAPNLDVVTFAKHTDFYNQVNEYKALEDAASFCAHLKNQISSGEQYGFYYPESFNQEEFIQPIITLVHEQFFANRKTLSVKERRDFIEIFYFFLILWILDVRQPDSVSFTCKDGIDTGAAEMALFYGFSRMLSHNAEWSDTDKDFFLFSLYTPALLIRHRALDLEPFTRTLSALEHFEKALKANRTAILKKCAKIFPDFPIEDVKVA